MLIYTNNTTKLVQADTCGTSETVRQVIYPTV